MFTFKNTPIYDELPRVGRPLGPPTKVPKRIVDHDGPLSDVLCLEGQQSIDEPAGSVLKVIARDGSVVGRTYNAGPAGTGALFIPQIVTSYTSDPKKEFDLNKTIKAARSASWFEHVIPMGRNKLDPAAVAVVLQPLIEYATKGAYFIAACIDSAIVLMPARTEPDAWGFRKEDIVMARYHSYVLARDGTGRLATQAMAVITPRPTSSGIEIVPRKYAPIDQIAMTVSYRGCETYRTVQGFDEYGRPAVFSVRLEPDGSEPPGQRTRENNLRYIYSSND